AFPGRVRARARRADRFCRVRLDEPRPAAVAADDPDRLRCVRVGLAPRAAARPFRPCAESAAMKQYLDLIRDVLDNGVDKSDRTGVGTRSVFGRQMRFDLRQGFPLLTTKKVHTRSIIVELLWFLKGETNNNWLRERGCTIWDEWALEDGDL